MIETIAFSKGGLYDIHVFHHGEVVLIEAVSDEYPSQRIFIDLPGLRRMVNVLMDAHAVLEDFNA